MIELQKEEKLCLVNCVQSHTSGSFVKVVSKEGKIKSEATSLRLHDKEGDCLPCNNKIYLIRRSYL